MLKTTGTIANNNSYLYSLNPVCYPVALWLCHWGKPHTLSGTAGPGMCQSHISNKP